MLFKINFQMIMLTSVTKMLWGKGVGQYVWFFFLKKIVCLLLACVFTFCRAPHPHPKLNVSPIELNPWTLASCVRGKINFGILWG